MMFIKMPWKDIATSLPFYSIIWCNFVYDWSIFFLIFEQPKFFNDVFEFDASEVRTLSFLFNYASYSTKRLSIRQSNV